MMNYFDLTTNPRAIFLTLIFLTVCLAIALLLMTFKRKRLLPKILVPMCFFVSFVVLVLYTTVPRANKKDAFVPELVTDFCEIPLIFSIIALILIVGYLSYEVYVEIRYRRNSLTRFSIKESLDKLPTALCFYEPNGKIVLVNHSMNDLCHKIVGRDLQNAALFWEILSGGEIKAGVERLDTGSQPTFKLPNGRIWSFVKTVFEDDLIQLTAADTTELSKINSELAKRSCELKIINERLRKYGESVDELTRTRERIEIKANIHRELGQALLVTRKYLIDEKTDTDAPISIWKKNIAMLKAQAEYKGEYSALEMLLQASKAAGVEIVLNGELPKSPQQSKFYVTSAVECLVNGARHAGATVLYITVTETENEISVTYENNGEIPKCEIVEGTGLSSLRYGAKKLGGRMEVKSAPKYSLTIILPKGVE